MQVDELHLAILDELQTDARLTNAEIGRRVGLTAPAVSERIRRMEEEGIIKGFSVNINFKKLNYAENVLIGVKLPMKYDTSFLMELEKIDGVSNVVRVAGEYCFFIFLTLKSVDELHSILSKFGEFGDTLTYSIMSNPIENKPLNLSERKRKSGLQKSLD